MVLCFILVNLMDRDSGVHNRRLNSLLLDNRLDVLMHMVVDMFACNRWSDSGAASRLADDTCVFELGSLVSEVFLDVRVVAVLDLAMVNGSHVVGVLLGEDFLLEDGLHGGVVVVLVHFAVDGCGDVLMMGMGNLLVGHGWIDDLGCVIRGAREW